ncbi:MAG TPA: ATP-binding cassette domain-containing protein [Gaiellaceae bacterium]|nr:ATP-binding cassette domain-containing protein [Gaiellaceae bacterium]
MSALELRDAAVELGGRRVWSHVDIAVEPGSFVAVLGPNGAGKSTLLKVALGLLPLEHGTVHVNGEIGYLPQHRNFDASSRIRGIDIVRLGLDGARFGVSLPRTNDERRAAVEEVIRLVGAEAYAQRAIGTLSGGEQQRLLIAQALVRKPKLLMLDEPLDSLDLPNQVAVAALVQRICREQDVAVLLVAHDVNPILGYLDQVVYFAGGTAVSGAPHDVITSATLSTLYGAPIEVLSTNDGRLVVVGQPEAPFVHGHRHEH